MPASHLFAAAELIEQAMSHLTNALQAAAPVRRGVSDPQVEELRLLVHALADIREALVQAAQRTPAD